jgi:hypothetical protein
MTKNEFEELVKQVYFYCDSRDPNGLYADKDIDLREFSSKLIAVYEAKKAISENQLTVCSLLAPSAHKPQSPQETER